MGVIIPTCKRRHIAGTDVGCGETLILTKGDAWVCPNCDGDDPLTEHVYPEEDNEDGGQAA